MVRQLSTELQEYMDSYLVEFTLLAHDPIYKKAVTNGRLFNHSHNHPNLVLEDRSKHSMQSSREVNIVLVLCATHKIKAGEQMLWCYGDEYAAVSLILAPLQPPPTLDMPWEEALSMSQHAPNMQLAPITTRAALISLALRSDVAGMVIAPEPFDDVDEAYRLGRQSSVESLVIPESASQLFRLLNASVKDAFENMHPVVLLLKRRVRDDKPLVLLIGAPFPDDSNLWRYANCLVFVKAVGQTYIMACVVISYTSVHK
ncbi:hypothetical protein ANCCAN_11975 [Ancylostoma caninum]|uniref:SET domain-containing protein n=1 Tax=Ancylostoma caninum TaxID=29170 RepID=A0A368GCF6_ANCCA|nr:hypothetical protein ANCCAN_11975 [Ancylostoma caninum]